MFTIANYNYECSKKCKNTDHGKAIGKAVRKSKASDEKLAAYIAKSCKNFAGIADDEGITALHLASQTGRIALAEWLINYGAQLNAVDVRRGYTPLHCAMKERHIELAVLLQRYGANSDIPDKYHRHALNYCISDMPQEVKFASKEIFVWGSNKNYNLGIGNEEGRQHPQQLDFFSKMNIFIQKVALSKYHCLYLDDAGNIYSVGHGKGCQLGIGNEGTLVVPQLVHVPLRKKDFVVDVSAARNHSLVMTSRNCVFSCGMNDQHQLGYNQDKQMKFKEVQFISNNTPMLVNKLKGIIAKELHSIAYTDRDIYVWGNNIGQFGNIFDYIATIPTPVKIETYGHTVLLVDSSNAAIVCYTSQNVIIVYYGHKIRTIKTPTHETIKSLTVRGGDITNDEDVLNILVLTESGTAYVWYADIKQYIRCRLPLSECIADGQKILYSSDRLMYVANGDVFMGKSSMVNVKKNSNIAPDEYQETLTYRKDVLCVTKEIVVTIQRIPFVNEVQNIYTDQEGKSFIALQNHCKRYLEIPEIVQDELNFKNLLIEAAEDDSIHDVIFHVDDETFPAHKYMICSRAPGLGNLIAAQKHVYLQHPNLSSKMFELILKNIYNNHSLTMADVEDIETSLNVIDGLDNLEVFTMFREYAGQFGLAKFANAVSMQGGSSKKQSFQLSRHDCPQLHDITLKCADNRELKAHKCILVARMEYFQLMFRNNWSETKTVNLTTVPIDYMEPIIDFLYTNDAEQIRQQNYSDNFIYNMIVICDQYFINRLRNIFELLVIERISIKKCAEMLEFACDYNCKMLKKVCLDFMVLNMARLLEYRILDGLNSDMLQLVCRHYHTQKRVGHNITYDDTVNDVMLESFVADFKVDLGYKISEDQKLKERKARTSSTNQQDRRIYEKKAIDANKSRELDYCTKTDERKVPEASPLLLEAAKLSEELVSKVQSWTKVPDKKDAKKKSFPGALKTNEILSIEQKEKDAFVSLSKTHSPRAEPVTPPSTKPIECSTPIARSSLSLGEFTPQIGAKISQKQRKSQSVVAELQRFGMMTPKKDGDADTSPMTIVENVWATKTMIQSPPSNALQSQSLNDSFFHHSMGIPSTSTSANVTGGRSPLSPFSGRPPKTKSLSFDNNSTATVEDLSKSFTKILKDEKKERDYYEKLKTKSLVLTQIEETAIDELKKFYNIENVHDENIFVGRKLQVQPSMNFTVWHH